MCFCFLSLCFVLYSFVFFLRVLSFRLVSFRVASFRFVLFGCDSFRAVSPRFLCCFCVVPFRFVSFRLIAAPTNFGLGRTVRYRGSAGKARSRPAPVAGFRGRKPRSQAKQGRQPGVFPYFPFPKNVATTSLLVSLLVVMWYQGLRGQMSAF